MAGADGPLLSASGNLKLDAFGFFQVEGGFAIEQRNQAVTLSAAYNAQGIETAAASTVNARLLTIGASNLNAFVGIDGGTADALGLQLSGVEFGVALISEVTPAGTAPRKWTSLQASAKP